MQKSWIWIYMLLLFSACFTPESASLNQLAPLSEAGEAMRAFTANRVNAAGELDREAYLRAFFQHQSLRQDISRHHGNVWQALGPANIAGRMLSLAFHPTDTNLIYAGAASGGLWKSTSQGKGPGAWERMELGWPVLSVSAISLKPGNPDHIWIGTGEIYDLETPQVPVGRLTEMGMYGMGVLHSTDAGESWNPVSLDPQQNIRAIFDIKIHPLDPDLIFVATSEGLYRSQDGGLIWEKLWAESMVTKLALHPLQPHQLWMAAGNPGQEAIAVLYSDNQGESFVPRMSQLPEAKGKASLSYAVGGAGLFVVLSDPDRSLGLFSWSENEQKWGQLYDEEVSGEKGWYAQELLHTKDGALWWGGIDLWRADSMGASLKKKSDWTLMPMGKAAINAGPPTYVHADIHGLYESPHGSGEVFIATDGGIFVADASGTTFEARNGGLQTTQFHAPIASSGQRPDWVVGGLQDNASLIYDGSGLANRVLGGDGTGALMHPYEDEILLFTQPFLELYVSENGGQQFTPLTVPVGSNDESTAFRAPIALSSCEPLVLYAGREALYRSFDLGKSWDQISLHGPENLSLQVIEVSPRNSRLVYAAKNRLPGEKPLVYRITEGSNEIVGESLPPLPVTDIAFHPSEPEEVYLSLGGFGGSHVFRSRDGGSSWEDLDRGLLPDVPTHTIFLDPANPEHIYIGNDLGVYISPDGGESWAIYSSQLAEAVLVVDFAYSPTNRNLRVATFGNGLFETTLLEPAIPYEINAPDETLLTVFPNPARGSAQLSLALPLAEPLSLSIYDASGRLVERLLPLQEGVCQYETTLNLEGWAAGIYLFVLDLPERKERLSQKLWVQ